MRENSQQQAQELCSLLDIILTQIQADDQADEDVKLAAFDIREDIRFFQEAIFWSELRLNGQTAASQTTENLVLTAERNEYTALSPSLASPGKAADIGKNGRSAQYSATLGDTCYGGLVGTGVASLHHVHHALMNQIPASILTHVFGELAAGACGGAILSLVISAICNRLRGDA